MTIPEQIEAMSNAITAVELASILHLGKTAIYDMARRGVIPHYRISGSLRFDPQAVAEWLRAHAIENTTHRRRK